MQVLQRAMNRPNLVLNGVGQGANQFARSAFYLNFADLGSGVVDTLAARSGAAATFTRATSAWTNLSDGTIGLVASGSPRSYYSPTGTYLGYLAEGARTNVCQRGEDFTAVWTDVGTPTVAAGVSIGALDLTTLGDDSAAALEGKIQTVTFTGDAVKAISVYVKQGTATSSVIRVRDTSAPADRLLAAVTWSGSVPVVTMTTGTDLTGTPQQQGSSGVYRLSFATTSVTAANTNSLQIYPATDAALAVTGTGTILAGGVQAEDATFPSSLIRTPGSATVTRNADVLTYPLTGWFNAVAGTVLTQFQVNALSAAGQAFISIDDTTTAERIQHYVNGGAIQAELVVDGNVSQADLGVGNMLAANTTTKFAGAYAANDFSVCATGNAVATDTSGTLPTVTRILVGGRATAGLELFGPISRIAYWSTRLTNAQLQAVTT